MALQKFESRPGAIDFGKDYEYLMAALHALRFAMDDAVLNYRLSTNNKDMGDFDDLVLEVQYRDGERHLYAFQLKHKAKNDKKLALNSFARHNGDFSLRRYKREYDKIHDIYRKKKDEFEAHFRHFYFLLYTNASVDGTQTEADHLEIGQNGEIRIVRHDQCVGRGLINVCDTLETNYIFRFENNGDQKLEGHFLQQFFLYTKQKNARAVECAVDRLIFEQFPYCDPDVGSKILGYFKRWYRGDCGRFKLTKWDLKVKLAEYLLAPFVPQLVVGSWQNADSHNWNLLAEAMLEFDVTWLQDFDGSADQIWAVILGEFRLRLAKHADSWTQPIPEFTATKLVEMMQLPEAAQLENSTELSLRDAYLMMWQQNRMPLLLSVDDDQAWDVIQGAINLFKDEEPKKKFVLLTKQNRGLSKTFSGLHSLNNLISSPLYAEILDKFQVSLQGGHPMSLAALVESGDLTQMITASLLVQMASQVITVGQNASLKLPQPYVPRMVPKITLKTDVLREVDELFVVTCPNVYQLHAQINMHTVHIQDYLTSRRRPDTKRYAPIAPNDKFLIVSKTISANQFDEICALNPNSCCHLVSLNNDLVVEWRGSSKSVTKLHQFRIDSDEFITDSAVASQFHGPISVLCADPGMGKSVTLNYFKVLWSANDWVVKIDLNIHVKDFREQLDDVSLAHKLLNTNNLNLESATVRSYIKRKKLIVMWDGFDELPSSCTQRVIDIIFKFRHLGYRQWIASRNWSKNYLEQIFDTMSLTLNQFSDDNQYQYVETRCLAHCQEYGYNVDEVHRTAVAMRQNMAVLFDCGYSDYSGVPLQIYMLTEIFLQDPRKYMDRAEDEITTVVDIYREFIRGKFDRLFHKADADTQNYHMERIQERYKKMVLEQYEEAALKYTFDYAPNLTDRCAEMLDDIAASGDSLGMIIHINEDKKPTFAHRTYQEFLAASWLSKNYHDHKELVQDLYDLEELSNVRLMFDILVVEKSQPLVAILVKNYTLLKGSKHNLRDIRDQMGRTGLHLACSYGRRHPKLKQHKGKVRSFIRLLYEENDKNHLEVVDLLLDRGCDPLVCDQFLKWDAFHYADRTLSLAALNLLLKYKTYPVEKLTNYDAPSILHYCVKFGYGSLFDNLKDLPYVEYENILKWSMLQAAVESQRFSFIGKLLKFDHYKAVVNKLDSNQMTPVGAAAGLGHLATIELLVANGAKLVGLPYPPLIRAVEAQRLHVVEELIRKYSVNVNEIGVDGDTAFLKAVFTNQLQMLKFLVENGADAYHINNEFNALHYALISDNMDAIKFIINRKLDLNRKCVGGYTALHTVSEEGKIPVLELLLESGADPTIKTDQGDVPLHTALLHGQEEAALILLRFDRSVRDELNNMDYTPLVCAAKFGHQKVVHELLAMGADPDGPPSPHSPLKYAIDNGNNTIVTLLLENGAQVNTKSPTGVSPLHCAALNGRLVAAQELLNLGADIDAKDNNGNTALIVASKNKQPLIVELLLKSGASVNATNKNGVCALHAAAMRCEDCVDSLLKWKPDLEAHSVQYQYTPLTCSIIVGNTSVTKKLVQAGASVNRVDHCQGPLHVAAIMGDLVSLRVLLEGGADVNASCVSKLNFRPLHFAASFNRTYLMTTFTVLAVNNDNVPDNWLLSENHQGCVAELAKMGADVNAKCHNGITPLHLACARSRLAIVPTLLDLGAEVNAVTDTNVTPLHAASWMGSIQHVRVLVQKGATVNALDDFGRTPLCYAAEIGNDEILDYLMSAGGDVNFEEGSNLSCTPLLMAIANGNISSIAKLLESGAATNQFGYVDESLLLGVPNFLDLLLASIVTFSSGGLTRFKLSISEAISEWTSLMLQSWRNPGDKAEMNSLMVACKYGNLAVVQLLIEHGADVNAANSLGWTPLSISRHYQRQDVVDYLVNMVNLDNEMVLERGSELAPLQPQATCTASSLHHPAIQSMLLECFVLEAIRCNSLHMVRCLHQHGAIFNSKLLQAALDIDNVPIFDYLFNNTKDKSLDSLFLYAYSSKHVQGLKYLIDRGADINTTNTEGCAVLSLACCEGHPEMVKFLLQNGADVNKPDSTDKTAIFYAIESKNWEVIHLVVDWGASVQFQNIEDESPLHHTIRCSGDPEVVKFLIDRGASIHQRNKLGMTPLHWAARTASLRSAKYLIDAGADVHQVDNIKRTTLDYACTEECLDLVQLFVDLGVEIDAANNNGNTALFGAAANGLTGTVRYLRSKGAQIHVVDRQGDTPLHDAASNGHLDVVKYLVEMGADVNWRNNNGKTPLDLAINEEVAQYLSDVKPLT